MTAAALPTADHPSSASRATPRPPRDRTPAADKAEMAAEFADEIVELQRVHGETFAQALDRLVAEEAELDRHIGAILQAARASA